jgi:hypothetical protein
MSKYSLTHLSDGAVLSNLTALVARDRANTAELLAHLAEVDARKLYLPAGYSSMHAYCIDGLHLSEDMTWKRIQAARAGRQWPGLFEALADGRLHLSGICLLAPHMSAHSAVELVKACAGRANGRSRSCSPSDSLGRRGCQSWKPCRNPRLNLPRGRLESPAER